MKIGKDKKALDKLYRRRDRYDLQPGFQREKVWPESKQQKLMDTILKKWDIPKIYFRLVDEENFECIDGQQRLTAIFRFYDNELKLPKDSGIFKGFFYNDLPDNIKDIFDDYELDLALIEEVTDEELGELFQRLQLGVPLNSAEKLNALSGNMRDFVKNLSEDPFFKSKTTLSEKRYAFQSVCAQLCLLEIEGIKNAKFADLMEFYKRNEAFEKNSFNGKRILEVLSEMNTIFQTKTSAFKNRASVISFYLLLSELFKNKIKLDEKLRKTLKDFYVNFQQELKNEIEKGAKATDTELIVYQSKVNQAADSKDSILKRHQILRRRLILFNESFKDYLPLEEKEEELTELQKKDCIRQLTDDIIEKITGINKAYSINNQEDLFKPTSEILSCLKVISTPVTSKEEFGTFIDSMYKLFYEGSGSLNRIPKDLIKEDSILLEIKHLRTEFRHDIEHGNRKDIEHKREIISEICKKYTGEKTLDKANNKDFILAQNLILTKTNKILQEIKNKI